MSAASKAEASAASAEARDELRVAVDDLTQPRNIPHMQGKKLTSQQHAPLLDQLRAAIGSTVGGGSGGGKLGLERSPLDLGAFALFEEVDGRVRAWLVEIGAQVGKDVTPTQALRSWFVLWNATHHEPADHARRRRVLEGWSDRIDLVVDPPRRIELGGSDAVPCPACGEEYLLQGRERLGGGIDADEAAWTRALAVYERGSLEESYAACGVCGQRWEGVRELRALRIAIDDGESRSAAPEQHDGSAAPDGQPLAEQNHEGKTR